MDILRFLPDNEYQASVNANAPTALNPFATIADISASGNGIFDAANDGGTVPATFEVNLTDTISFNGGNVGIGTTSPLYGLDIQQSTYALNVEGTSPSGGVAFRMLIDQTTSRTNAAVAAMAFEGDATNINTAGLQLSMNPLIGGTSPALRIIGTPNAEYGAIFTLKGGSTFASDLGGTNALNYKSDTGALNVGFIGNANSKLFVYNQNALTNVVAFADSTNTKYFTITDAGVASYTGTGVQMGIGTATPLAKLQVVTNDYQFNGVSDEIKFTNNLGDWLTFKNGGGLSINDYQTGLGADLGTQNLDTYFLDYNFKSMRTSPNPSGSSYLSFDRNLSNSAPFTKMGINTVNTEATTLLQVNLDKFGSLIATSPTVVEILDNYGTHDLDLAGAEKIKTGYKADLNASFKTTTTGKGIVRSLWVNAQGGDENQAIYAENGDVIVDNGKVGIGTTTPSSELTVNGDVETLTNSKGFVVLDRTNGNRYRIYTDGGVLNTELVP